MQLLEHFKELTSHPKNAKELKGLILQLAIQGKLTNKWRDQHTGLELASAIDEKIRVEKEKLIKDGKIRKEKPLPPIVKEEISNEFPEDWHVCRLGEIGIINPRNHAEDQAVIGFIPMKNISQSYGVMPNFEEREWGSVKKSFTHFQNNDVAFAKITPCFENSKACVFSNLPNGLGAGTTELHVFRSIVFDIYSNFIYLIFKSPNFLHSGENKMTGSAGQKRVPKDFFSNYVIALPPFQEQKAIVEIVEQLFKEVEQLEAQTKLRIQLKEDYVSSALRTLSTQTTEQAWQSLLPHFKEFFTEKSAVKKLRETVLQLAVQGKLTKKWRVKNPDVEPTSVLLEKIKAEKDQLIKNKKIKKEKPLPPITKEEIPYELPEGWEWARFQKVYDVRDGTHDSPKDSQNKLTYPLVTSKNFKNGMIDFESARRISEEDYGKVIKRSKVDKGDVLFSMIGGNIGNQVIVGDFTDFAIKNVALFKHYKYGLPEPGFINIYSKYIAMNLQNQAAGGAQPFVSLKFFRNLVLGLPSIEEQKAIVEKVNVLMAFCDQLEEAIEESTIQIEQLMQSCLKEVFEDKKKQL